MVNALTDVNNGRGMLDSLLKRYSTKALMIKFHTIKAEVGRRWLLVAMGVTHSGILMAGGGAGGEKTMGCSMEDRLCTVWTDP